MEMKFFIVRMNIIQPRHLKRLGISMFVVIINILLLNPSFNVKYTLLYIKYILPFLIKLADFFCNCLVYNLLLICFYAYCIRPNI